MMAWLSIPMISYFITLFYAAVMFHFFGREWLLSQEDLLDEFIVITMWSYQLWFLGIVIVKTKSVLKTSHF